MKVWEWALLAGMGYVAYRMASNTVENAVGNNPITQAWENTENAWESAVSGIGSIPAIIGEAVKGLFPQPLEPWNARTPRGFDDLVDRLW